MRIGSGGIARRAGRPIPVLVNHKFAGLATDCSLLFEKQSSALGGPHMANDNANVLKAAEGKVGKDALMKTGYGSDCFVLVDQILRDLGLATAADGDVKVTPTADYDWGDGIMLDSIQPGDILQFKKHVVDVANMKYANGKWYEASGYTLTRPHHTAIVMEVRKDGSVLVVEQNV